MPKISIIMGVYNSESTILNCIESIKAQTFNDWEFIICDDGSTDNSYNLLVEESKKDSRLLILKNEKNLGLGASLNNCIHVASSKTLIRQDADDTSRKDRIEIMYKEFVKRDKLAVLGSSANLIKGKEVWGERVVPLWPTLEQWCLGSQVIHASVVMNKLDIIEAGLYNPKALRVEDIELWFRLLEKGMKIESIGEKLYNIEWSPLDYKRKKTIYRIYEFFVMFKGIYKLRVSKRYLIYSLKPLVLIFIPRKLLYFFHKGRFKNYE